MGMAWEREYWNIPWQRKSWKWRVKGKTRTCHDISKFGREERQGMTRQWGMMQDGLVSHGNTVIAQWLLKLEYIMTSASLEGKRSKERPDHKGWCKTVSHGNTVIAQGLFKQCFQSPLQVRNPQYCLIPWGRISQRCTNSVAHAMVLLCVYLALSLMCVCVRG